MATAAFSRLTPQLTFSPNGHHHHSHSPSFITYSSTTHFVKVSLSSNSSLQLIGSLHSPRRPSFIPFASVGGGDDSGGLGGGGGGGGGGGDGDGDAGKRNKAEAIMALAEAGRSLDSIPTDLAAAIEAGRIPGSIVRRFFDLEKSPFLGWLLQFGGFKERLLADDLFLTKVGIECGVGIFTKVRSFKDFSYVHHIGLIALI